MLSGILFEIIEGVLQQIEQDEQIEGLVTPEAEVRSLVQDLRWSVRVIDQEPLRCPIPFSVYRSWAILPVRERRALRLSWNAMSLLLVMSNATA